MFCRRPERGCERRPTLRLQPRPPRRAPRAARRAVDANPFGDRGDLQLDDNLASSIFRPSSNYHTVLFLKFLNSMFLN